MSCEVSLMAHTPDAARVVAAAAKLCYSPSRAADLFAGLDAERTRSFISRLSSAGHLSPFEHASFTFAVDGLSRVASHQLVRHRLASYSQQSQRYVTMREPRAVMPPSIASNDAARAEFERARDESFAAYERMIAAGVPKEDARSILPHGWETSLVLTMNARELHHFFALRLCRRAQWEIRALASRMLALVHEAAPELFEGAGPACVSRGGCREEHPCGRPFSGIGELIAQGGQA